MKDYAKLILVVFSLISSCLTLSEKCVSNFQCMDSACCSDGLCVASDTCKKIQHNVYLAVGLVGLFFLIATLIYFLYSMMSTRARVRKIKEDMKKNE